MPLPLLASQIFARSQGAECNGPSECHWCSAPCGNQWNHDEPPPIIGVRKGLGFSRRPSNPWLCVGCWHWRRNSVTATYLDGKQKDRQAAQACSWLVTEERALAIRKECYSKLLQLLQAPPTRFFLSLLTEGHAPNHLQCCKANNLAGGVKAEQPILFTLNNIPHAYTLHDLDEGLKNGPEGMEPGVGALLNLLKDVVKPLAKSLPPTLIERREVPDKKGRGRPTKPEEARKRVMSG